MSGTPVIGRELLIASRSPMLYRGRAIGAATALGYLGMTMMGQSPGQESGETLFAALDQAIILMLLVVAPLMTADSISKERREGTLDLLFLTPLRAPKIVSSKFVARLWQLLSFWLVMVPLMIVPVLAGGLTATLVVSCLLKQFSLIILLLGAGMLASAMVRRALPAMLLAWGLSLPLLWFVTRLNATAPGAGATVTFGRGGGVLVLQQAPDFWSFSNFIFQPASRWGLTAVVSILLTILLLKAAAQLIAERQKERSESEARKWFREVFLTPHYWQDGFRSWLSRKMDRNPLIWLEYRRTGSRAARWMLVLLLVVIETYAVSYLSSDGWFLMVQLQSAFVLMLVIAVTSAGSFQRERENGAFELLLVAPFTESSLLNGRLRAVWGYYLPALLKLAISFWLAFTWMETRLIPWIGPEAREFARALSLGCSAITIPLAGLYYALRGRRFLISLIGTVLFTLIMPYYLLEYIVVIWSSVFNPYVGVSYTFPYVTVTLGLHAALGTVFYLKAYRALQNRQFT